MAKRHTPAFQIFVPVLAAVLLSHCTAPVSVRMEKPVAPVGAPAATVGVDHHLASIRNAHDRIRRGDDSAIPAYNYSVARLVEELERRGADPWSGTITSMGTSGTFRLKGSHPADSKPLEHKLIPTDTLDFRGEIAEEQSKVDGLGAPVVELGSIDKSRPPKAPRQPAAAQSDRPRPLRGGSRPARTRRSLSGRTRQSRRTRAPARRRLRSRHHARHVQGARGQTRARATPPPDPLQRHCEPQFHAAIRPEAHPGAIRPRSRQHARHFRADVFQTPAGPGNPQKLSVLGFQLSERLSLSLLRVPAPP